MEYVVEKETVGRFTVKVIVDHAVDLEWAYNDEPVAIYGLERGRFWTAVDQTKAGGVSADFARAYEEGNTSECLNILCDYRYCGWGWTNGKVRVEDIDWNRARYFKNEENALAALFLPEYGFPLSDLRVEQFGDYPSTFYLEFRQSELDAYAGCKNAVSCRNSLQAVVDGETYGFIIEDGDGETVDSCWGFIGPASYCLEEGISAAKYLEAQAIERDALAFACTAESSRPDMYT